MGASRRRGRGRSIRLGVLVLAVWLSLVGLAPAAAAATGGWPVMALGTLRSWLTGAGPAARVPVQQTGHASRLHGIVPAALTRAGVGQGRPPGRGRGQLPEYRVHMPAVRKVMTGPDVFAPSSFNPHTSRPILSRTSATSDWFRNVNGTLTRRVYAGPVNYRTSSGTWAAIDTALAPGPGDRWRERGNSLDLSFASRANAGVLGSIGLADGESYGFGLAEAAAVTGTVSGSAVTYQGVLPETDLTLSGAQAGLGETLTLHSASASASWLFPLTLSGLTPVLDQGGSVSLVDKAGAAVVRIPAGLAWDSSRRGRSGLPGHTAPASWQLTTYDGLPALRLSISLAWLTEPSRVFPVTVDPTGAESVTGTTYVETGDENTNNSQQQYMLMGTYNGGTDVARTLLQFGNLGNVGSDDLQNYHITAATLDVFDVWGYTCSAEPIDAFANTESWNLTSESWTGPTVGRVIGTMDGAAPVCTGSPSPTVGTWMGVPLNSYGLNDLNGWTLNTGNNYGLSLRADSETTDDQWKQFDGYYNSPNIPYLELTYAADVAPQINATYPQNNYNESSLEPELLASGNDPDNWPDPLTYQIVVENSSGTRVAVSTPGGYNTSGSGWISDPDWTVPGNDLQWGQTYSWYVQDFDGLEFGTSAVSVFSTQVPQPDVSGGQNEGAQGISPGSSSYTTSVTDADVSTVGPALSIERDYDSQDAGVIGAFGAGWSSLLDMKVTPWQQADYSGKILPDIQVVTYPDGSQVGFGMNWDTETYTAPQGRYSTLTGNLDGTGPFVLTDKNDTQYSFLEQLPSGAWGISSITDALGNELVFNWNEQDSEITSITSEASGRSLTLTWGKPTGATSPLVESVTTNDVTSGQSSSALTWSYAYSGDELTGVCDPESASSCAGQTGCPSGSGGCTAYAYTQGTDFEQGVLDTGPHSYWPLDDTGAKAESAVLANEGTDDGTYSDVTLGQPGGLAGSTAASASFNGTSSDVRLPSDLVSGASYQSISLWFKTTTGGGVLFSSSQDPVSVEDGVASTTTNPYTPNLYLGTGGDLHGEYWDGSASPIMSSASVADGKWHFVVLTAAGNTQTLYLDGQAIGSIPATTIDNSSLDNEYVGAGYLGGNWPNEPNQGSGSTGFASFFGGNISDVGFWDRPLSASEVSQLYADGATTAEQLSQVTRPSGSVYSKVSYNTVTGAVSKVTDDNGGTWTLKSPTVSGSSQVYVASVLVHDPADYWRLDDTQEQGTAVNQVNGGVATYNNVVLGTLADFAGESGSYVALPVDMLNAATAESVSLWFFPTGQTLNHSMVLLSANNDPITDSNPQDSDLPVLTIVDGYLNGNFSFGAGDHCATAINDQQWYNAVLTAGPPEGGESTQDLYLDGQLCESYESESPAISDTPYNYLGTGFIGGTTAGFGGLMNDFAYYQAQLTAAQVSEEYQASQNSLGLTPVVTEQVTDPGGNTLSYEMDPLNGDRVIAETDGMGQTTRFGYDTDGFQDVTVDPDGNETILGHDPRGNV